MDNIKINDAKLYNMIKCNNDYIINFIGLGDNKKKQKKDQPDNNDNSDYKKYTEKETVKLNNSETLGLTEDQKKELEKAIKTVNDVININIDDYNELDDAIDDLIKIDEDIESNVIKTEDEGNLFELNDDEEIFDDDDYNLLNKNNDEED